MKLNREKKPILGFGFRRELLEGALLVKKSWYRKYYTRLIKELISECLLAEKKIYQYLIKKAPGILDIKKQLNNLYPPILPKIYAQSYTCMNLICGLKFSN